MQNIQEAIPVYRTHGQPAWQTITFKRRPNSGDTITIDGTVYTFGTDFNGTDSVNTAKSFAMTVRSDVQFSQFPVNMRPIRSHSAIFYGDMVVVFSTQPGTLGNAIALSTSNASDITLGGATMANGTSPSTTIAIANESSVTAEFGSVQTSAVGATRVTLASKACKRLNFYNDTGASLEFQRGGAGTVYRLGDGFSKVFYVSANANELSVRRTDTANGQVTAYYETENY